MYYPIFEFWSMNFYWYYCDCRNIDSREDEDKIIKELALAQNPIQFSRERDSSDVEMGKLSQNRLKALNTNVEVVVLNESDTKASDKSTDHQSAITSVSNIVSLLEKAKKVQGVDGADNIFNQAVLASRQLHYVCEDYPCLS